MAEQKYICMMFSSTPSKMGSFVRAVTHNQYNHVSLCIEEEGMTLYSFARKYKRHPFYGGFVKESSLRFVYRNRFANIKLCAIPVTDEQFIAVKRFTHTMEQDADCYVYNHFSAIGTIVNKRIRIDNAYTCVEFNVKILRDIGIISKEQEQHIMSVKDLEFLLQKYAVYEGSFAQIANNVSDAGDKFANEKSICVGTWKAFCTNSKLIYSLLRSI